MKKDCSCGLEQPVANDLKGHLEKAKQTDYSFTVVPLSHPNYVFNASESCFSTDLRSMRIEHHLNCRDWNQLVAKVSDWLNPDDANELFAQKSCTTLINELNYACHTGVSCVIVELKRGGDHSRLSSIIYDKMVERGFYLPSFCLQVPMLSKKSKSRQYRNDVEVPESDDLEDDTWLWWDQFRLSCDSHYKLSLSLEVTADLPPQEHLNRWLGEPIKYIILPTSIFLTNKKGFPVLSTAHQKFVKEAASHGAEFVVTGNIRHSSPKYYAQYIKFLHYKAYEWHCEQSFKGFEDVLQTPLQPLMDNLDGGTYSSFEKDPVKYTVYQEAIHDALLDRVPAEKADEITQVVMVVGAGRGPLVTAAISAAKIAGRKIKVYAVEKNPNAFNTLRYFKAHAWGDAVDIVMCDMRIWDAPEKCDILVSELLGSFACNELSPECLDGAQRFLKADGISIPQSYTSYLAPISTMKLFNEAKRFETDGVQPNAISETPFVVYPLTSYIIAPVQEVFTFVHPNPDPDPDNRRYKSLEFQIDEHSTLYGFVGYFDTLLYGKRKLSIVPETFSEGMFSWYPLFFPIREPVSLKKGDSLKVNFWRQSNKSTVWYEWSLSKPVIMPAHNFRGCHSRMNL